ncbi:hypothetical protein BEP19_13305 [Ammoniphilus oxalaticus]|uniref:DUF218 domain-containing protein n=1 Tax=Ammoniphilus oxalaticus TaxID=66863 RepID=A0A419SHC8_9BACL|nr:YdcF family protein [Ammoniphilus oxalaticus]RKD23188.1 hypothetical protein BEP19_13305 [Ammoniphilus oxalaticus]
MKKRKIRYTTLSFSLIILLNLILFFLFGGRYLLVDERPIHADAIILLTGGNTERHEKAVELYYQGYAPRFIVSNATEDGIYEAVLNHGVPEQSVWKENKADSTFTNAVYTRNIIKQAKLKSAIIVSSDYHMRRVKVNFDRVYRGSDIQLTYCSAETDYQPKKWLLDQQSRQIAINEYIKLIGNRFGYNGIEAKQILKQMK